MHKSLFAAVAAAIILSAALLGQRAEAMPARPQTLGLAKANAAFIQQVVTLCGMNGCAPVQTSRARHHRHP